MTGRIRLDGHAAARQADADGDRRCECGVLLGTTVRDARAAHLEHLAELGVERTVPAQVVEAAPVVDFEWPAMRALGPWGERAACRDSDAAPFDAPAEGEDPVAMLARHMQAAKDCARCEVRLECLADARDNGAVGVWGGLLLGVGGGRKPRDLVLELTDPRARRFAERRAAYNAAARSTTRRTA